MTADILDEILSGGPTARGETPGGPNHAAFLERQRKAATEAAKPKTTPHKRLLRAVVKALKSRWPACKLEVRTVGFFQTRDRARVRRVFVGQAGEADIRVTLQGLAIAIEIKATETGDKQSDAQARWQRRFEGAGGVYGIARSVDEALAIVERAIRSDRCNER